MMARDSWGRAHGGERRGVGGAVVLCGEVATTAWATLVGCCLYRSGQVLRNDASPCWRVEVIDGPCPIAMASGGARSPGILAIVAWRAGWLLKHSSAGLRARLFPARCYAQPRYQCMAAFDSRPLPGHWLRYGCSAVIMLACRRRALRCPRAASSWHRQLCGTTGG